ncbi:MAG: PIG-L family deacetylase [Bacteriovoracaceae bacterium]|jgi:N-acetylglucosamine malate deacetylase 1|nr:PIG-L family deacetylase [Bacteriovoracaceae bacterium]
MIPNGTSKKTVLIIAAHPDDEALGCGATISFLASSGHNVHGLILSQGKASRDGKSVEKEVETLSGEIEKSSKVLGFKDMSVLNFADNRFDSVDMLDIVKEIEIIKDKVQPDIVFTHHAGDLNIDHRIAHIATLTAFRPISGEKNTSIYSYEVPSSTEWNSYSAESVFIPNTFVDVGSTIEKKVEAMGCYQSELREYPHPRSLDYLKVLASHRGVQSGKQFAEAFCLIRATV